MLERGREPGAPIYEDHRDNLNIDVQSDLVLAHAAEMRHAHSESALLWNVLRALQNLDGRVWLPRLLRQALPAWSAEHFAPDAAAAQLGNIEWSWWRRHDLPPERHAWLRDAALCGCLPLEHYAPRSIPEKRAEIERRLAGELAFEDPVEIPLCLETPSWLIAFEAVYKGNLRRHTTFDSRRDAVLRLVDAGTHAASQRGKGFAAIVLCTDTRVLNLETARLVERYRDKPERLAEALPHRGDAEVVGAAAHAVGMLRWKDLGALLIEAKGEERLGAFDLAAIDEIIKYLGRKDIGFNFFRRLK
jgi:hypothetical protein